MAVRFTSSSQSYSRTISIPASQAFTIACWVKISVNRGDVTVWCLNQDNSNYTYLGTDSDGTTMGVWTSAEAVQQATRTLTVGVWYFVAVTVSSDGTGTVYYRSQTEATFTSQSWDWDLVGEPISKLVISGYTTSSPPDWLNGCVSGLTWWSTQLTAAELLVESHSQMPVRTIGLRAWWPLLQAGDTADYSGKGLALSGGTGSSTEDGPGVRWRQRRRTLITPLEIPAQVDAPRIAGLANIPAPDVSLGTTAEAPRLGGITSIPTPSIYTGDPVTPVEAPHIAGIAGVSAPGVSTVKNASVSAPLIAVHAGVLSPIVTVPIIPGDDLDGHGQLSYNGFRLGTEVYRLRRLAGTPWDMAAIDNGDEPHPSAHGALPGQKLAELRIVTAEFQITCPHDTDAAQSAADAFVQAFPVPDADEQLSIAIQIYDTIWAGSGACIRRDAPIDQLAYLGYIPASVQFAMTDPRFYSRALQSATVPDGGDINVLNAGNTSTRPLIRIPGPAHQPLIEISRMLPDGTEDVRVIEYDVEVPTGQALIIDVQQSAVTLGGASQARARTTNSVSIPDMVLGKGISTIAYETGPGAAPPAVVLWRHTYL